MGAINGVDEEANTAMAARTRRPHDADVEGEDAVAIQHQIRDLDAKVEDIRSSMATIEVGQATAAGKVEVLATKLDGFKENVEDRITALETERSRDEWRAWAERLGAAIVGAGGLELARQFLSRG